MRDVSPSRGATILVDVIAQRGLTCRTRTTAHIKLEYAGDHDNGLRSMAVLEQRKTERLGAIDEEPTARAALVLDDPVSPAVFADHEQGRSRSRGRFTFSHISSPLILSSGSGSVELVV
jgi:hypothetical protein